MLKEFIKLEYKKQDAIFKKANFEDNNINVWFDNWFNEGSHQEKKALVNKSVDYSIEKNLSKEEKAQREKDIALMAGLREIHRKSQQKNLIMDKKKAKRDYYKNLKKKKKKS